MSSSVQHSNKDVCRRLSRVCSKGVLVCVARVSVLGSALSLSSNFLQHSVWLLQVRIQELMLKVSEKKIQAASEGLLCEGVTFRSCNFFFLLMFCWPGDHSLLVYIIILGLVSEMVMPALPHHSL